MIKACIFDLDGTLLNSLPTITYYVNKTFSENGIPPLSEQECVRFVGRGAMALIRGALAYRGVTEGDTVARLFGEYTAAYDKDTLYLTRAYDGIGEMLDALSAGGIKLGVLSNKPHFATRDVVSSFFKGKFDIVHGGRDGVPLKPAPDALLAMIDELSLSPDEIMYIGDMAVDIKTGLAAGVASVVGVSWGFRDRTELCEAGAGVIADTPAQIVREALSNA